MNYEILINKENRLDESYVPELLVDASKCVNKSCTYTESEKPVKVHKVVLQKFDKLNYEASKLGYRYYIDSSYRSFAFQEKLLNNCIKEMGKKAYEYCALPGCSEHQLGLAIDLAYEDSKGNYIWQIEDGSQEYSWLVDNSYKFGFILRYPKGKEFITGVMFEPWHFRYVGEKLAKEISLNKLTLEEYYKNKI